MGMRSLSFRRFGLLSMSLFLGIPAALASSPAVQKNEASAAKAKFVLRVLYSTPPTTVFRTQFTEFAKRVKKASKGEVEMQMLWSTPMQVAENQIPAKVSGGEAEMGYVYTTDLLPISKDLLVFDMPFVFKDYAHLERVLGGKVGESILAGLKPGNLKGLGFTYTGGFENLSTLDKVVKNPADLKGLKIATTGTEANKLWIEHAGAIPVDTGVCCERVNSYLEKGEVNAVLANFRRYYQYYPHRPVFSYQPHNVINKLNATMTAGVIFMNNEYFEKLPKKIQKIIVSEGRRLTTKNRNVDVTYFAEVEADYRMMPFFTVSSLTDKEQREFEAFFSPLREKFLGMLDNKDLLKKIESLRKPPTKPLERIGMGKKL